PLGRSCAHPCLPPLPTRRSSDLLQARFDLEVKELENERDSAINDRALSAEKDLAQLEEEGAKADAKRKVRDSGEREQAQIRKKYDAEIDRITRIWERFKTLKVADLEGDEQLYRAMKLRYGTYFEGGMGAEALQRRLADFDLEAEAASLREVI